MIFGVELIEELERLDPTIRSAFLKILRLIERSIGEVVKKEDFRELKNSVETLTENVNKLSKTVGELAEAQKRTEQRVEELAEAQKETQKEVSRLDKALQELAEAQKRTEEELRELTKEHKITRQLVVNLSDTVGYGLEDKLFPYIKDFAQKEYGIKVKKFGRKNLVYANGKYDELNIFIEGDRGKKPVYVIGECKAQLGKKDIDKFSHILKRVSKHLNAEVEGFLVSYTISPEVEKYIEDFYPELKFYYSYHFELNYRRLQEN
jgi:vacuolar-type H+-ATPase subunit I/STV1